MGIAGNYLYRTSDGGTVWEDISASLPHDPNFFPKSVFCISQDKWIVGGSYYVADYFNTRENIIFTPDWGDTWLDKTGNLTDFLLPSGTVDGFSFDLLGAAFANE